MAGRRWIGGCLRAGWLTMLIAALAVGSATAHAATTSAPSVILTVTETGTYSDSWQGPLSSSGSEDVQWSDTDHFRFDYHAASGAYSETAHTSNVTATGTFTQTFPTQPSGDLNCKVIGGVTGWTARVAPETPGTPTPATYSMEGGPPEVVLRGPNCAGTGTGTGTTPPRRLECEPTDGCIEYPPNFSTARFGKWGSAWTSAGSVSPLGKLPEHLTFGDTLPGPPDTNTMSEVLNICEGTFRACHPVVKASPLSAPKLAAQKDFKLAFADALGPCVQLGAGLGVLATGAIWLGTSAAAPGGIPAGGAVLSVGQVMLAAATPLCVPKLRRLLDDYRRFDDPPDRQYGRLARVAAAGATPNLNVCGGLSGRVRAYCLALRGLVARLIVAARHTAAVDDAMVSTMNRASGALRAGATGALATQLRHLQALQGQFTAALRSEAALGRAIRRLVPRGRLSAARTRSAGTYVRGRLGRGGVMIATIDPAARTPSPLDPIARLVAP